MRTNLTVALGSRLALVAGVTELVNVEPAIVIEFSVGFAIFKVSTSSGLVESSR